MRTTSERNAQTDGVKAYSAAAAKNPEIKAQSGISLFSRSLCISHAAAVAAGTAGSIGSSETAYSPASQHSHTYCSHKHKDM